MSERQIDVERERWARLNRAQGILGDPLDLFDPCMECGQRGPRVTLWQRQGVTEAACRQLPRDEQIRLSGTWVCADGCPASGEGEGHGHEEDEQG